MNVNNNNEPNMFETTMETIPMIATDEAITPTGEHPKKRGRPAKVEKQIFIDVWNKASNLNEVASMLGMPRASVSVKASNLRKTGCNLKMFRRGRRRKTAI